MAAVNENARPTLRFAESRYTRLAAERDQLIDSLKQMSEAIYTSFIRNEARSQDCHILEQCIRDCHLGRYSDAYGRVQTCSDNCQKYLADYNLGSLGESLHSTWQILHSQQWDCGSDFASPSCCPVASGASSSEEIFSGNPPTTPASLGDSQRTMLGANLYARSSMILGDRDHLPQLVSTGVSNETSNCVHEPIFEAFQSPQPILMRASAEDNGNDEEVLSSHDFEILPDDSVTLLVRNIPARFSRDDLVELWPPHGCYNLLYLPYSFKHRRTIGSVFINFISHEAAVTFRRKWHGQSLVVESKAKPLAFATADVQGLYANLSVLLSSKKIVQMRNTNLFPALFDVEGNRIDIKEFLKNRIDDSRSTP